MRTPANLIATLALFLSLGGGAYAVSAVPRNSIGPSQIRGGAVRSSEIARDAVRASELAPASVTREDLAFGLGEAAGNGDSATEALEPKAGEWTPALATRLVVGQRGLLALASGAVTVTNPPDDKGAAATVTVRVRHNGEAEHPEFTQTIADGMTGTIPVSIQCNGFRPGEQRFTLEVLRYGGDVTVGARTLDVASFGPIFNPPG
jgi:hypothetical protein